MVNIVKSRSTFVLLEQIISVCLEATKVFLESSLILEIHTNETSAICDPFNTEAFLPIQTFSPKIAFLV